MADQRWSNDYPIDKTLGVNSDALSSLYQKLQSAGCTDISTKLYLPDGEQLIAKTAEELNEISTSRFSHATGVYVSCELPDASLILRLSGEEDLSSRYWVSGTSRNSIHILKGMVEDFSQEYSSNEAIQAADFVTRRKFAIGPAAIPAQNNAVVRDMSAGSEDKTSIPADAVSLSKKLRPIPDELPYAKLYLDDIEEISRILLETYEQGPNRRQSNPWIKYTIGNEEYSSLTALAARGGATQNLRIEIANEYCMSVRITTWIRPSVTLYGLGEKSEWAVYGRLRLVFESREYTLKNAILSLSTWLKCLLYGAALIGFQLLPNPHGSKSAIAAIVAYVTVLALVATELFRHNKVVLSPSHRSSKKLNDRLLVYLQNFLFTILGAALSVIFQVVYDHLRSK